jgi:hypothetical protein
MSDTQQRFQMLAEQFAVLEHNLSVARNAEQRAEVLKGMNTVIVIEELDQLILANQTWLDSKLGSIASNNNLYAPAPRTQAR